MSLVPRLCFVAVLVLALPAAHGAPVDVSTPTAADTALVDLRRQALDDPAGAIARGRTLLDRRTHTIAPDEREVLRWMGKAALLASNEAALSEVTLRLDSLAETQHDAVAAAYAGFLRADRAFDRGAIDAAMQEALAAAERLQDRREPELRGLVAYQLCDALSSAEAYARAQTYCGEAEDIYRVLRDEYNLARTENVHSYVFYNQAHVDDAVNLAESARRRFLTLGETGLAGVVGDNLARMYIEQGHAIQALELSQASLAAERQSGRLGHALASRANIARAYGALGRHPQALSEIADAIAEARALKLDGRLPDLYDTQSRLAERAGDMALALTAARATKDTQDRAHALGKHDDLATLETRYAAREKDLRIGELERDARLRELAVEASDARDAARAANESLRRWSIAGAIALGVMLCVAAVLLILLLRTRRRHAARLHQIANTDPLTGCGNRRAFFLRLETAMARVPAPPCALLLIDLDDFKRINDRYGHPFGDAVLRQAAEAMQTVIAGRGFLARIGGEEFGVYCPELAPTEALRLAESIRVAVSELRLDSSAGDVSASVSIGVAMYDAERFRFVEAWLKQADRALAVAKARGRNRVVASTAVG